MVRVVEVARDLLMLTIHILYIFIYIKEGSVCWYDGLSCKLNSNMLSKVQFLFFLIYIYVHGYTLSSYSSTVERNTVNILIYVQFILGAIFNKYIIRVSLRVKHSVSATIIQVRILYTFNKTALRFKTNQSHAYEDLS